MPVEGAGPEWLPDDVLGAGWLGAGWLGAGWLGAGGLGAEVLGAGLTVPPFDLEPVLTLPPPPVLTYVGGVDRRAGLGAALWLGRAV